MEKKKNELATNISSQSLINFTPTSKDLRQYTSAELCIKSDVPTLGAIKRALGEEKVEALIKVWIINLQESLNLKRQMTPHQIDECAWLIVSDFNALNIADIHLIFTNAKKGRYGELYESLSMAKIITWFDVYKNERMDIAAELSQRESQGFKYKEKRNNGGKKFRDYLKGL